MESDRNPIRGFIVDIANWINKDKKDTDYSKMLNDFKIMLEDSSSMNKIRNDDTLDNIVNDIYNILKNNYIN